VPWYELTKVVHYLGLIALVGFFIIYSRVGPRLRAATDMKEVRVLLGLLDLARPMMPGGAAMLLLSGLAMVAMRWKGPYPFVTVGFIALIVIWTGVAIVGGRHLRAMHSAAGTNEGAVPAELARVILDPRPWTTLFALNTTALGVLVVMTTKLDWAWAIGVVVAMAALGGLVGSSMVKRDREKTGAVTRAVNA
jgi:hypothetical protein